MPISVVQEEFNLLDDLFLYFCNYIFNRGFVVYVFKNVVTSNLCKSVFL